MQTLVDTDDEGPSLSYLEATAPVAVIGMLDLCAEIQRGIGLICDVPAPPSDFWTTIWED
jgi:hypothetical protein